MAFTSHNLMKLFLCFFILLLSHANSVSFNFTSFNPEMIRNLSLEGDAFLSGGVLQLTKTHEKDSNLKFSVGRASYFQPVQIWDYKTGKLADFSTHISFEVTAFDRLIYGDGLAFFLAPVDSKIPKNSTGGFLGLFSPETAFDGASKNQIAAVEYDLHQNSWDPYYHYGSHIGIDVNSIVSDISLRGPYMLGPANAWPNYYSAGKILSVHFETSGFIRDLRLDYPIDMRKFLPEFAKVGPSAATGSSVELHSIRSWSFKS